MNPQEYTESRSAAVVSLPHRTESPEFDHLVDEIQHPETTEALYEMPLRTPPEES
ncbi:hypothetical protein [Kitasatospora camelliae]|uniref:Uncharacterized protein n=1 Tax=Kitasatospora camelliae TaxID=3156397 RepID=A0AAU8K4S6_9ACTN